jgi:7,8-dihydropterin-6-yl-methyl-4-(beta-D-ribofuranosyl)aminobenzene 5'-phosphate synthase
MKIISLLENTTLQKELTPKHGLSLYIETGHKKILFDTGPDHTFIKNAEKLKVNLEAIDLVFLSHGHYDHGGGIPAFQKLNKTARIILSQSAMNPFYARLPLGLSKQIGLPREQMDTSRCDFISQDQQIDENIHIFTRFGQLGLIPLGNRSLLVKNNQGKKVEDDFTHEIALLICEENANVLFTGCSHSGVSNMVESVLNRSGLDRIDLVIGGFHLFNPVTRKTESPERIQQLVTELAAYPVTKFYTGHCTGKKAFAHLKELMKDRISEFKTGTEIRV